MTITAIMNLKGGVGKTTLAVSLADLAAQKSSVLLMDANATQESALDWIALNTTLAGRERVRGVRLAKPLSASFIREPTFAAHTFIDTAPAINSVTQSVAIFADIVVIPTRLGLFDELTIKRTLGAINDAEKARREYNSRRLDKILVVSAPGAQRQEALNLIGDLRRAFTDARIYPHVLTERIAHRRAIRAGGTAATMEPRSDAAAEMRDLFTFIYPGVL